MSAERHFSKHYTLDEARALLPKVRLWLPDIRRLGKAVGRAEERNAPLLAEGRDLGGERVDEHLRTLTLLQEIIREINALQIQVKDLDRGLVDFPSLRGDREVLLCWEEGEDDIEFWHDLESGYPGRKPV